MKMPFQAKIDPIPFTKDAYEKLQTEYDRLLQEREEVKERLTVAREMGDLSENGAYRYAKQEMSSIGRQLRDLMYQLKFGVVITKTQSEIVDFGTTVTVSDGVKESTYLIVSKYESDPKQNKISGESPLGSALVGRKVGDRVEVVLPHSTILYTVLSIQ